ncbi:MAG: T9SS type A sorting domain-containing protein, partial [Bacteroidetes bacterium]|nr:T9SS type A sorting domain-containing protein [Bacteroidota bacterium]
EAEINLYYKGNLVGNAVWRGSSNTTGWTEFSASINYDPTFSGIPDSATIFLSLMDNNGTSKKPGNWFLVDDLYLSAWSTSLHGSNINTLHAQLYPNPARDYVYLSLNSPAAGTLQYRLTDVSGRTALTGICNIPGSGPQQCTIPLQALSPGHYLLQFSMQGHFYQERILVQP